MWNRLLKIFFSLSLQANKPFTVSNINDIQKKLSKNIAVEEWAIVFRLIEIFFELLDKDDGWDKSNQSVLLSTGRWKKTKYFVRYDY